MSAAVLSFALGAGGACLGAACVAGLARLWAAPSLVHIHLSGFALGFAAFVVAAWLLPGAHPFWPGASVVAAGGALLLFVHATIAKSVSVRMALALADSADGTLPVAELSEGLARRLIAGRVDVLVAMGLVEAADKDAFRITGQGRRLAQRLTAARRLFGVEAVTLYGDRPAPARTTDRRGGASR